MRHLFSLRHSLRALDVCNGGVTDAGVVAIASLSLLEQLNLSQNWRVSDASIPPLCTLAHLRTLGLSGTRITAAGVTLLGSLAPSSLVALALHGCKVAAEAEAVQAARPSLRITCADDSAVP
jgi:hypothetical protein